MRTRLSVLVLLLACAAPRPQPPRGEEVLRVEGKVENAPFRFGRDDLPQLPRRAFEASPPGQERSAKVEGIALAELLADRMEVKQEADTAVMHGDRGVAVPVPLAVIRQLRPILTVQDADRARSASGAAPLSLAWPTKDHPGIETDPRLRWWWVHGVRTISVESWVETYGRALHVPVGASDEARHGADVLGAQCIGCHRVRGTGGTRGPALTGSEGPARRLRDHARSLRDHLRTVAETATAPELTPLAATEVAEFLDAAMQAGPEPEEPIAPPPSPPIEEPFPTAPIGAPGAPAVER